MERIILHVYNMFWIYRTQGYINRTFMVGWKWSMYISQYVCEPILRSQSIDEKSLLDSFWSTLGKTHPALFHHSLRQLLWVYSSSFVINIFYILFILDEHVVDGIICVVDSWFQWFFLDCGQNWKRCTNNQ